MKATRTVSILTIIFAALCVLGACKNPLDPPSLPELAQTASGVFRIYIGENAAAQARTIQPGSAAVEGYRLTFSGGTHDPVNVTPGESHADVYLADGTWTITATAYRKDGEVGNEADAVASGSISITVSGGAVSGAIPSIILKVIEGGEDGTFSYNITVESGASGSLTLWEIDGLTKVNELPLSETVADAYDLSPGRYIAEAKLNNLEGNVAFRREVVEIWPGTASDFIFAPTSETYLNPDALLAGSTAALSETETQVNGAPIGTATSGSGASEDDPKTYTVSAADRGNIEFIVKFAPESSYASYTWAQTNGAAPGGIYTSGDLPTDFSTNNVLWVKAVSEDSGTRAYYKFVIKSQETPTNGSFTDMDTDFDEISGIISWVRPVNFSDVHGYRIYLGSSETDVLMTGAFYPDIVGVGNTSQEVVVDTELLPGAKYFLVYSYNAAGIFPECLAIPIVDVGSYGNFLINTDTKAGISYDLPTQTLTISQSGTYYINGNGTTADRIQVKKADADINANIILKDVNIDVSAMADAAAFDANATNASGVTVNLTFEGINSLKSGDNKAGVRVPSNTVLTISETAIGTLTATGGDSGAGIGSGNGEGVGKINIAGGKLNANGGSNGAGIGGGNGRSSEIINISGGTITARGGSNGAGIGGGNYGNAEGITITGGTITATGGSNGAGIGCGSFTGGGAITITGGTITATGGSYGAGIGSGDNYGGVVTRIEGGIITATGGNYGAGIGGGFNGGGGTISITGGTVTANGGSYGVGGSGSGEAGTITVLKNALVFASSIRPVLTEGDNLDNAIVFIGNTGTLYGDYTLASDLTLASGKMLTINSQDTLTIPGSVTLTNNGSIFVHDGGNIDGTVSANQQVFASLTISGDAGYTYRNRALTIAENGTYTIGMKAGVTGITMERIIVTSGVEANITLSGVNIDMSAAVMSAFDITGATVNLTIVGNNILKSGQDRAGLEAPEGSTLTISGAGSLTASGGQYGAGIGSGSSRNSGSIHITGGTVTANGGQYGAGIGGGYYGKGGIVRITGGTIIANGGSYNGYQYNSGIGGGYSTTGGTVTEISNAVVITSSIRPALAEDANVNNSLVVSDSAGTVYGDAALTSSITLATGKTLTIPGGNSLDIPASITLTNNGTIMVYGELTETGIVSGNKPVFAPLSISGDTAYTYVDGLLTITENGTYTIGMRNGAISGTDRIQVAPGLTTNITLSGVNIDTSAASNASAFDMTGATVNLTLAGDSVLKSGANRAGLEAPEGSTLTVNGTGSLSATGGTSGAGIGGGSGASGGTITIAGGTITAKGVYARTAGGAGIGGGFNGNGGTINITGGTITATIITLSGGAGIGGGFNGNGGTISITGGAITAISDAYGAGIGGGGTGNPGTITALNNVIVYVSSISSPLVSGGNLNDSIIFTGGTGIVYGDVTLDGNLSVSAEQVMYVDGTNKLTIPAELTLNNEGQIFIAENNSIDGAVNGNPQELIPLTISSDTGYTYSGNTLVITGNGTYAIGMRPGLDSTTLEAISVASRVTANITLTDVNIDVSASITSAFNLAAEAVVNLTLVGESTLKGGNRRAGIEVPNGTTLVVNGNNSGSLNAIGGALAAGIGAGLSSQSQGYGYGGSAGTISIFDAVVTATGDRGSAGIGGAGSDHNAPGGAGGNVSISNAVVTANGGIGGFDRGVGTLTVGSNAVVFLAGAAPVHPPLTDGKNINNAAIFVGNTGTIYGNFILTKDLTVDTARTLTVASGKSLTVSGGATLTNNGTVTNSGTIYNAGTISNQGTIDNQGIILNYPGAVINGIAVTGNQPETPNLTPDLTVTGDPSYIITNNFLAITGNGEYTIEMRGGVPQTTSLGIVVASGVNAKITLKSVDIYLRNTSGVFAGNGLSAFDMAGATVELVLLGDNVLESGFQRAAIEAPEGSSLTISSESTGSLTANAYYNNSGGIGGRYIDGGKGNSGSITIAGGTVNARGGVNVAGIGGGAFGNGGTIRITGGTVTATGGSNAAGIGGGTQGNGGKVTITGGFVRVAGYTGIGGGNSGASGTITALNNAVVFANTIQPTLIEGDNLNDAIVFIGNDGTLYGNLTLTNDVIIDGGKTLTIASGKSLTIAEDITLTNDGTIDNQGTITNNGVIAGNGTVTGNEPITP